MARKDSPQSVIESYRKRQQVMPFLVGGFAVLLVAIGIIILVVWFTGGNRPAFALFASATPTPTETATSTPVPPTLTPSLTPTETQIPTETVTSTPSGPFEYTVQELDTCWDIAVTYEVGLDVLLAINGFAAGQCPISPGDTIMIPQPGAELATETPLPTNIARGTQIQYSVKLGESMDMIASRFNSTVDEIIRLTNIYNRENDLDVMEDNNTIYAGQILIVPVNIVTPTATIAPTSTSANATAAPTASATTAP
jgi:LysM repeat protein